MNNKFKECFVLIIKFIITIIYIIFSIVSICTHEVCELKFLISEFFVYLCLIIFLIMILFYYD